MLSLTNHADENVADSERLSDANQTFQKITRRLVPLLFI